MRVPLTRRLALLLIPLTLMVSCIGAQRRLIDARASAYVFHRPITEVSAAVRALLAEKDFSVSSMSGDTVVRTDWRTAFEAEGIATTYERHLVVIRPLTPQHCRLEMVHLTRATVGMETAHPTLSGGTAARNNDGTQSRGEAGTGNRPLPLGPAILARDLDSEWELIQRLEPVRARQIVAAVDDHLARKAKSPH